MRNAWILAALLIGGMTTLVWGHFPPGEPFFAVKFPDGNVPSVDGDISDWSMVPQVPYEVPNTRYWEGIFGKGRGEMDLSDLNPRVMIGWNESANRLYLIAEVFDNIHHVDRTEAGGWWADDAWEMDLSPSHPSEQGGGNNPGSEGGILKQSFNVSVPPLAGWGQFLPAFDWRTDPNNEDTWKFAWNFKGEEFGESTYFYEYWILPVDFFPDNGDRSAIEIHDMQDGDVLGIEWAITDFDAPGTTYQGFWSTADGGKKQTDLILSEFDDSIDWGVATAAKPDTWGRLKADFR